MPSSNEEHDQCQANRTLRRQIKEELSEITDRKRSIFKVQPYAGSPWIQKEIAMVVCKESYKKKKRCFSNGPAINATLLE